MEQYDHREIGKRQGLFHLQEEGPGVVFWHPRGFALFQVLEGYVRQRMKAAGFREVRTPQLLPAALWEKSGHLEKFGDKMFALEAGERRFALKPMSCPAHLQIFGRGQRSYRDLPVRLAEFGVCHRNEASGALLGLLRTRAFVQDDAHVFCAEEQVEEEVARFCALLRRIYADLEFAAVRIALSTRPAKRAGSAATWDHAEAALAAAARAAGLDFQIDTGEGAFYGPKLDFHLRDRQGREWQCGTVQLDFVLPERLEARYIDSQGRERQPVMIHHAVLGSLERFIGILLEHHGGQLPLWLAPDQIAVASISDAQNPQADVIATELEGEGFRVARDMRSERLARKVVDAREAGIPVLLVVGDREARNGTVSLRRRDGTQQTLAVGAVADLLRPEAFR